MARGRISAYSVHHLPTDSNFIFIGPNLGATDWSGRMKSGTDPDRPWKAESWEEVLMTAQQWATEVAEWEGTPDL
jgi:hypothetical protein